MKKNRIYFVVISLVMALVVTLGGCTASPPAPTTTSPAPSLSPSPVLTPSPTPTVMPPAPAPSPTPTATPAPTSTPVQTPTVTPAPAPAATPAPTVAVAEVNVTSDRAVVDFPNKITFTVEGTSGLPVKGVSLEYAAEKRSVTSETSRVEPQFAKETKVNATYAWEMKKTGSIPPGATVWWRWRITDEAGRVAVTPRQVMTYDDTRYQWKVEATSLMDIYWANQDAGLIKELTAGLESRLSRLKLEVAIPKERKPKIYVYASSEQIRGAVLFTQEWTGALAYPQYNIILTAVNLSNLTWAKNTIAHEVTHLLVGEAVFGPFGDVPTWLNEGLAEYGGGDTDAYNRTLLDSAIKQGKLISLRSLGGSFPTDPQQAGLAYAQSASLVSYLIDTYGWAKMREVLNVFKEGSTYDGALKKVFSIDTATLEKQWRARIGAS